MKSRGKLVNVTRNITNNKLMVTFEVDASADEINALAEQDLTIEAKKFSAKRTLTMNAYYWTLVGKLAEATDSTNAEIHNMMLRSYGTLQDMDGEIIPVLVPDTPKAFKKALNDEVVHLKPTSTLRMGADGYLRRVYHILKGSSDMTRDEFSRLLDGTIQECKDIGIETMSPEEIERLRWLSGER